MAKLPIIIAIVILFIFLVSLAPAVPPGKIIEYDVIDVGRIVFDGKEHAKKGLKCSNCHPKIFPMKKASNNITMAEINSGKKCGFCHNGNKASKFGQGFSLTSTLADDCKEAKDYVTEGNRYLETSPSRAEELYMKAVKLCPKSANIYINLALSQIAQKKYSEAETSLKKAEEIRPSDKKVKEVRDSLEKIVRVWETEHTPDLEVVSVTIDDRSGNGKIEPAEIVEVTARIQNKGQGLAKGVNARVKLGENVFFIQDSRTEFSIGDMEPGVFIDITFSIHTRKIDRGIPISIELSETGRSKFNKTEPLNLVFNHQYRIPRNYFILGLGDIEDLLKGGVSDKRIVKLINKHGISFIPTEENLGILRDAGANEAVIEAAKEAGQRNLLIEKPAPIKASKLYETAFIAFKDKRYKEAREKFETFIKTFPNDDLIDDAQFWVAETYYSEKDFEGAILAYETLLKKYPNSEKAPASLLKQGLSFIEIGDKKTGKIILEQLRERYPYSKEAELARERIEGLLEKKTAIKVKQVTGEVKIIDIIDRTITIVKKIKGNIVEIVITVDDKTKITLAKEKRTLEDVKVGDKVTIKYTEDDGKNVAKSIIVKPISL